jgi:hypothetical protein
VYNPSLAKVPGPVTDHFTTLFVLPDITAENCCLPAAPSSALSGEILIDTDGLSKICTLADFVTSALLIAEIVTVVSERTCAGAKYSPFRERNPGPLHVQ